LADLGKLATVVLGVVKEGLAFWNWFHKTH
jgi:hypothetical protein